MAEFILGRIKFVYRNNWTALTVYVVDDVVTTGGKTYICIANHTASTQFTTDYDPVPSLSKWNLLADGQQWRADWAPAEDYNAGDLVKYGGVVYQCTIPHASSTYVSPTWLGLEADSDKWDIFATSFDWKGTWDTSQRYKLNDVVSYGGQTFVCTSHHISAATEVLGLEDNSADWDVLNSGIKYLGDWSVLGSAYRYKANDLVKYGADLWIATAAHVSTSTFADGSWAIFLNGFQFESSWTNSTQYQIGDIVTYGGYSYVAKTNNLGKTPTTNMSDWAVYTTGFSFEGDWNNSTTYKIGSVVRNSGYTYLSELDSPSISSTATATTISTDGTNPNTITADATGFVAGMTAIFGSSFGGIVAGTRYFVLSSGLTASRFKISLVPGGAPVDLTTTTGQTVSITVAAGVENEIYWARLNSGFQWTNSPQTYTATAGTSQSPSVGVDATFDITRTGTVYNVSVNVGGTFYVAGDEILVPGTALGGLSPINDLTITVVSAPSGIISSVTSTGISVTWTTGSIYVLGDVVFFGANSYTCIAEHAATTGSRPDNDLSADYWNLLSAGAEVATLTTTGDTLYYGPNGPARLPIGRDGQVLRVKEGYPSWETYGHIFNAVFVGPTGLDLAYPASGFSIDQPWKTVRFACKQIEEGYRRPNAKHLLQVNKQFLINEANNFISYTYKASVTGTSGGTFLSADTSALNANMPVTFASQTGSLTINSVAINSSTTYYIKTIVNNVSFTVSATAGGAAVVASGTGTAVATFSYDSSKAERDAGIVIDSLLYDLTHGGTLKTTTSTLAYYDYSGTAYITTGTRDQITQFIGSHVYLRTLLGYVLGNTLAPTSYQSLNGTFNSSYQQINLDYTAESDAVTTAVALIDIVINGLTQGDTSTTATAITPNTTINVKTGTYTEVLPMVVPEYTAIVGDELRSTVIQPKTANSLLVNDKEKTISALTRVKALAPSIMSNTPVVVSAGNTFAQTYLYSSNDTVSSASITANTSSMVNILDNGLTAVPSVYTTPTPTGGTGNAFTAGYFDAARLVLANKAFLKAEVSAWIDAQILAGTVPFNGFVYAGTDRTKCERDVGYIVDALKYDLTYGGNLATVIAASSYYSNGVLVEVGEKEQAKAVQLRIKDIIDNIVTGNTAGWTKTPANVLVQVTTGPVGSAGAATFAQARIQEIYNNIDTGTTPTTIAPDITWPAADKLTANTAIQLNKTAIQANSLAWITNAYPNLTFNTTTCNRDVGFIIDALCYDMMFGSNFLSSWNAMSYYRATTSAAVVLADQFDAQVGLIGFVSASVKQYTGSTSGSAGSFVAIERAVAGANTIYDIVNTGFGAIPSIEFNTVPTGYNTSVLIGYGDGKAQVIQNYDFIIADVLQYYANSVTYGSIWSATSTVNRDKHKRRIKYLLDALQHDMTYGGNVQALIAGSEYYSFYLLNITAAEKPAFIDFLTFMKSLVDKIVQKSAIVAQAGNTVTRISTGTAGSAGASTFAQARIQDVIDWITNGSAPTSITPSITWATSDLQAAYAAVQSKRTEIALDASAWVQKFYQEVALDLLLTERDAGLIVDAICYDIVLGTNFNSMIAGRRYLAGTTSTETLLTTAEKQPTIGAINFIKYKIKNIAASGAIAQLQTTIDDVIGAITGGAGSRINYPLPTLPDATYSAVGGTNVVGTGSTATFNFVRTSVAFTPSIQAGGTGYAVNDQIKILGSAIGGASPANDITILVTAISGSAISAVKVLTAAEAVILLEDNREFILEEAIAYMNYTYPSIVYDEELTRRDAGYILDAVHYDLVYGGDFASQQAGQAYYTFGTSEISSYVKASVLATISRISTIAQQVIQNSTVTKTYGNTKAQVFKTNGAQLIGSSLTATTIGSLITKIYNYVNLGLDSGAPSITVTTIATTDTFTSNAHGLANGDLIEMRQASTNGLVLETTYYVVSSATNTFKLAATYAGTALTTFTNGTGLSISLHKTNMPYIGWVNALLVQEYLNLSTAKSAIQANVVAFIDNKYSNLVYDSGLAARDAGLNIDAVAFDIMLNSNFRSIKSGQAYNRPQSSVLTGRLLDSTRESLKYLQTQISATVYASPTAVSRANIAMTNVIQQLIEGSGQTPESTGTTVYNHDVRQHAGVEILRANTEFLAEESTAWVNANFGGTVTSTSSSGNLLTVTGHNLNVGDPVKFSFTTIIAVATATDSVTKKITLNSTSGIAVGMPVEFSGSLLFGGVVSSAIYFVESIVGSDITISETNGGAAGVIMTSSVGIMTATIGGVMGGVVADTLYFVLSIPSIDTLTVTAEQYSTTPMMLTSKIGAMRISYAYDAESCKRDMREFINAFVYDMQFTGNYKSKRAAVLYLNAIKGSQLSDMWHVRNGTGIRNMTMSGLLGSLSVPNDFGTQRPTAGAYTSLDPGFGPYDSNAWVYNRSCYVQNCTLFGTGCTALKIDGSLHAGGNRSIVANDYTTFISDGIGTWCTGANSLTELVSVFAYYSYAGYIAELGGKIRATNGNSSYGTYGVIAEGVDTYETPIYATVDNRANEAFITNVVTDGAEEVLRIEFSNAGNNYTNAEWNISGAGYNATAIGDEFRDYGVFETRLIDLDDGYGFGGGGYVTAANAAQVSNVGYLTIAASDTQLSTAYTGLRVLITAGTGAGQYAAILSYSNGSKVAKVYKESFANLTVTGTTITGNLITVASTVSLYTNMPIYLGTAVGGLLANTLYYVRSGFTATQFTVSTTSGGTAETITATTTGQSVTLYAAGWDHVIPGKVPTDALDLTSTYIIEPRITYSAPGYTATARTLASVATWQSVTYAAGKFLAIPTGSAATSYSTTGTTWSAAGNLPSSTTWIDVAYGGGEGATATAVVGGLGGIGAELQAVLGTGIDAGQVVGITIIKGGFGYLTPPTIKFASGLATAVAIVLNGEIVGVSVTVPGSGYVTAPVVTARTDIITSFTVNTYGKNYTSPPTVTVTGGGSSNQATGTAVLTSATNGVLSITVGNSGGTGYTSTPTVTIVDANAKFVAIPTTASGGTTKAAYQTSAGASANSAWSSSTGSMPNGTYASASYGGGYWVAVGGTASATRSADADSAWNAVTIPTLGAGSYSCVTYGDNIFLAISTGNLATAISTTSGSTWTASGNLPSSAAWTSVAYGNGRFVAIANGPSNKAAYSIDGGTTWTASPAGLPASVAWTDVTYGQGLFVAVASASAVCATSPDGRTWTQRAMSSSSSWKSVAFGNPGNNPVFAAVSLTSGQLASSIRTGATTQGRMKVGSGLVTEIRITEPGSGYPKGTITDTATSTNIITTSDTTNLIDSQPVEFTGLDSYGLTTGKPYYVIGSTIVANTSFKVSLIAGNATPVVLSTGSSLAGTYKAGPIVTQTDPNKTRLAPTRVRMGTGILGNPTFTNRGNANTTATANVGGDGYSDLYQASTFINVSGLFEAPKAGANVEFSSISGTWYKLVSVTNKLGSAGNYTATFQINPALSVLDAPNHGDAVTTRIKYSQVRLTGHDFLYIGTGNFSTTNYPNVNPSTAITDNQAYSSDGGRVFFTSTDQDGNFNVGGLFGVQQSTGTATLNASAFNLSGLQSLQLGTVSVGAGSATITSFSTDPYFTANSDNILPTQKAIKSYITAQIGGGQSSLNVNTLTSGVIYVANNSISTTSGVQINVRAKMNFTGGVDGAPVALAYFMQR